MEHLRDRVVLGDLAGQLVISPPFPLWNHHRLEVRRRDIQACFGLHHSIDAHTRQMLRIDDQLNAAFSRGSENQLQR